MPEPVQPSGVDVVAEVDRRWAATFAAATGWAPGRDLLAGRLRKVPPALVWVLERRALGRTGPPPVTGWLRWTTELGFRPETGDLLHTTVGRPGPPERAATPVTTTAVGRDGEIVSHWRTTRDHPGAPGGDPPGGGDLEEVATLPLGREWPLVLAAATRWWEPELIEPPGGGPSMVSGPAVAALAMAQAVAEDAPVRALRFTALAALPVPERVSVRVRELDRTGRPELAIVVTRTGDGSVVLEGTVSP